ncbi:uncharacterized protein [Clytia hemisphaerica]|uniref:uncharacterized protein n=1 Tax=Clytia hemisphaerica TaxID=252671 RepID=UPI0034D716BE
MDLKLKSKIHTLDPESKHWLPATILLIEENKIKVSWVGYPKDYNCWVSLNEVRKPIIKRDFPKRNIQLLKDPKYLQCGDVLHNSKSNKEIVVQTNDPFKGEGSGQDGEVCLYEQLRDIDFSIKDINKTSNDPEGNKEAVKERKEVATEGNDVSKDEKEVVSERKEIVSEMKEVASEKKKKVTKKKQQKAATNKKQQKAADIGGDVKINDSKQGGDELECLSEVFSTTIRKPSTRSFNKLEGAVLLTENTSSEALISRLVNI